MTTVSGTLSKAGLSSTITPTAGTIFSVTFGATASGIPLAIAPIVLMRSMDGTNFAPASPMLSSAGGIAPEFTQSGSIDIVEQRAGVVYALLALTTPVTPIAYRFDQ